MGYKLFPTRELDIGAAQAPNRVILAPMSGITDAPFRRLAEELGAGYVSSGYRDAMGFLIIIAVLIFKPTGLFARSERVG